MSGTLFVYENIRLSDDRKTVHFDYHIDTTEQTYNLSETLEFPAPLPETATVDRVLRALHLALGISYYKIFIPPMIDHGYEMDENEATFWNTVFRNGLAEFLYKNKLSQEQIGSFVSCRGQIVPAKDEDTNWKNNMLLGIGGGKDSIVAGEIAKNLSFELEGFVLATGDNTGQARAVAEVMNVPLHAVKRTIDSHIFALNKLEGAYNGHVPISLIFALVGCALACIYETKYIVVANESSASIPHVNHEGLSVNHQWSKSLEFEKLFQQFVKDYIAKDACYFSVVRPLSSVAVAKIFRNYPQYFEVFTSDNSHFKINKELEEHPRWGLMSAKSLSSYILLAPWINDEHLMSIFGRNFLDVPELESMFISLLGKSNTPILDCVGTPDELRLSLSLLHAQQRHQETHLMKQAVGRQFVMQHTDEMLSSAITPDDNHALPDELSENIISYLKEKLV